MTEKEIREIEALFGAPARIPREFSSWMADQFALAVPSIPISQLFGARSIERLFDIQTNSITVSGATETTIYETTIPGKSVAQNGRLKVVMPITLQDAAGAASATARVKLNGTTLHTQPMRAFFPTPDPSSLDVYVWNRDKYDLQVIESRWFYRKFWSPAAVDLSLDSTLTITAQFTGGDANDILVRKAAFASLYNPSD